MKQMIALLTLVAILASGCSGGATPTSAPSAATSSPPPTAPPPTPTTPPPTPTVASSPTPDIGIGGPCDHPYYPLRVGSSWTYHGSTGDWTTTVQSVTAAGANIHMDFGNSLTTDQVISCSDGAIVVPFGAMSGVNLSGSSLATVKITGQSGKFLPPAGEMEPGATWTSQFDMAGEVNTGGTVNTFTAKVTQDFTSISRESVTVAAGTFADALKVNVGTAFDMSMSIGGSSISVPFSFEQTIWFAPGVGWVKSSADAANLGSDLGVELASYSIP